MKTLLLASTLLCTTIAPTVALADVKLAYVDLQRALEETEDGKRAKAKLKSDFDRKQKELDQKQDELKKMKEDLDKKSSMMKPEALAKEQQDFQQRFVQLQEIYARLQRDLAAKEQEATHGIFAKLTTVVGKIAEREHLSLVLERSASVVWGLPSLDITNEVIRTYNTEAGTPKSK